MFILIIQLVGMTVVYLEKSVLCCQRWEEHYKYVIMSFMASQITSLTIVYSTVYSSADQRKYQSSVSLAFVWEFTGDWWIPRTKGQLRGKCFHLMTSSWNLAIQSQVLGSPRSRLNVKTVFPGMGIPMLKIRRLRDHLISLTWGFLY